MSKEEQDKTDALLESRRKVYGDRIDNCTRIAQMWSGFLGFEIQPWQVPVMQAINKMYRMNGAPDYADNIDDVDGWMRMAREVIGDDMIDARTVEDYLTGVAKRLETRAHEDEIKDLQESLTPVVDVETRREGEAMTQWERNRLEQGRRQGQFFARNSEYSSGNSMGDNVDLHREKSLDRAREALDDEGLADLNGSQL